MSVILVHGLALELGSYVLLDENLEPYRRIDKMLRGLKTRSARSFARSATTCESSDHELIETFFINMTMTFFFFG